MSNEFPSEELLLEIVGRLNAAERRLDDQLEPEQGWIPVFLDEPYTNTDFDGDSFSDVTTHTKIENTSWSTTIPSDAKALAMTITARDSGSAGTTALLVNLFSTASATEPALTLMVAGITNDAYSSVAGVVPCTDGDIWYRTNASGTNTLDIWLRVTGYWI